MKYLFIYFIIFITTTINAGMVTGVLLNATQDSSAVAGAPVYLQVLTNQTQKPSTLAETITNSSGQFRFTVSDINAEAVYVAATDYQGVRYFSAAENITNIAATDLSFVVYDSTHSTADVEAFMHHTIINDFGDVLQFRETRVLSNPTKKTITQAFVEEHIGPALFQFHLPPDAQNFTPLSAGAEELLLHLHHVVDRGVFLPGNKTVSFAYELPIAGQSVSVALKTTHAAKTFDIFVGSENIVIDSQQLEDKGTFDIRGTPYHRYGLANVNAATDIHFQVRRTGRAAEQSPAPTIILTSALLALALIYSLARKEKITKKRTPRSAGTKAGKKSRKKK